VTPIDQTPSECSRPPTSAEDRDSSQSVDGSTKKHKSNYCPPTNNVRDSRAKRKKKVKKKNAKRQKKEKLKTKRNHLLKYSGCLHWAGCDLLVDSPMNGVIDIHGAGEFKAYGPLDDYGRRNHVGRVEGIPHCVIAIV